MNGKARRHRRGSAIILAVGLLVLLFLLGTAFLVVAHLDRRESSSLALAAPMKNVALGVVGQIGGVLAADLYIDATGVYGKSDHSVKTYDYPHEDLDAARPMDKFLACIEPNPLAGGAYWAHVSNLPGNLGAAMVFLFDLANPANPNPLLSDTDGFDYLVGANHFTGDSLMFDSGVRDRLGRVYVVAVRVIDASGLLNANLHDAPARALAGSVMPITDVSLEAMIGTSALNSVRAARASGDTVPNYWRNYALRPLNFGPDGAPPALYKPFDMGDMLAAAWGGSFPSSASGRLWTALTPAANTGLYRSVQRYLTVQSAGRILTPRARQTTPYKADLNAPTPEVLRRAFYDMIPPGIPDISTDDNARWATAAQLAVNVLDFVDADSTPSVLDGGGVLAYGIERQPFLTEAAYCIKMINPGPPTPQYEYNYALELYNPYVSAMPMTGWKIKVGMAAPVDLAGGTIAALGRLVLCRGSEVKVTGAKEDVPTLDLKEEVMILRPASNGDLIVVARVRPTDFQNNPQSANPPDVNTPAKECIRRCDNLSDAIYTLCRPDLYKSFLDDITDAGQSNLGKGNGVLANDAAFMKNVGGVSVRPQATPVYVRNNVFTNVGELNRIFWVGPRAAGAGSDEKALDERLAHSSVVDRSNLPDPNLVVACNPWILENGHLSPTRVVPVTGANPAPYGDNRIPAVPLACMAGDFFMVWSPRADLVDNDGDGQADSADATFPEDTVYGQLSINTASKTALACLPGLFGLTPADRDKILNEIIAYRDLLNNASDGGANYSDKDAKGNPIVPRSDGSVGIPNLRAEPGFATPGEIMIPIFVRASKTGAGAIGAGSRLPQNGYQPSNAQPYNYCASALTGNNPDTTQDDGLSTGASAPQNDLVKHLVYHAWLSNHVTVRSDVYVAYIRVELRPTTTAPPVTVRRYVAVIDRSNCRTPADRPNVLMFAAIR